MAARVVLISLVVIAAVALSGVSGIVNGLMETAPSIDTINVIPDGYATTILNSKGKTIQTLVGKEANRQYATLDTIPKHLQNAFVAIEDERFWVHDGIDLQGIFRATFSGLSKSHMIAGFRIGWMVLSGNKAIAKDYIEGIKMLSNMRLCSNVPAQSVVQTALWGNQSVNDYLVPGGRIYEQREYIYKALTDIPGITAVKPQAAFYMFPKIDVKKFNIVNDEKFALDLLQDKKILIVQGSGFNWKQPDHFRVVYLPRIEVLKEAVGKISDFLSYYRQG